MKNDILFSLRLLSDAALVAGLKGSLARERGETANIVAHLAELDTRDVYLREGYTSLFVYCRDALGMSDGEAYNRIEVARVARRLPVVFEMLADVCSTASGWSGGRASDRRVWGDRYAGLPFGHLDTDLHSRGFRSAGSRTTTITKGGSISGNGGGHEYSFQNKLI